MHTYEDRQSGVHFHGSWQPWVAMGSAKAAKEALARYCDQGLALERLDAH